MPDFYSAGEYDLGGFAVGQVAPRDVLPKKEIKPGDVLIGVASSGVHSNGYSLLRKLIPVGPEGDEIARRLITPTKIYAKSMAPLIRERLVLGMAHITGSGYLNVPRMSEKVSYEIILPPISALPGSASIYTWVIEKSGLGLNELAQTFNLGIGMVLVVKKNKVPDVMKKLKKAGEKAWVIGQVVKKKPGQPSTVRVTSGHESVELIY